MDLGERGSARGKLGGVEGGETIVGIYCMREELKIINKKTNKINEQKEKVSLKVVLGTLVVSPPSSSSFPPISLPT